MQAEDLKSRILKKKKELNAVIMAHYYQVPEIQEIADFVGDSLALARQAARTDAEVIVACGVMFMAETAKILNPDKIVLIPDPEAGCPMADMITAEALRAKKAEMPDAAVVCYVNTSAAVKAESDICCTSANAVEVISSIPARQRILFVPDRNLGTYATQATGRDIVCWPGFCPVHDRLTVEKVNSAKTNRALVIAHPECPPPITAVADQVGSTGKMMKTAADPTVNNFVIATETGLLYSLRQAHPDKNFVPADPQMICADMKKITLEKLLYALEHLYQPVEVPEDIRRRALAATERMLAL